MAGVDTSFAIEEPPGGRSLRARTTVIDQHIERARDNPGEWCRVWAYNTSGAAATAATRLQAKHPDGVWTSSKRPDGTYGVYVKFI